MATEDSTETPAEQEKSLTPAVNSPSDAPSIFADIIHGVMVSDHVIKIFFMEHILPIEDQELKGRYVANICLPVPQLREIAKALNELADQTRK